MLSADPVFKEFDWRGVTERGMAASPVIERFDVVEPVGLGISLRTVAGAWHPLILLPEPQITFRLYAAKPFGLLSRVK